MYVSCNFIGQDEGNILLWHMAQRVTLFLLSPSHLEPQFDDYESIETLKWKKTLNERKKNIIANEKVKTFSIIN